MENPKTETVSEPEPKTTPHLIMGSSSPESPTKSYSSSSESEPPYPPARSPVHLTVGSSPESPSKSKTIGSQRKPPSSPARSPVHLSIESSPERPSKSDTTASSQAKPSSPPTRSPVDSPPHLSIGSSVEIPSKSNTFSSKPMEPSPPARSAECSPARSSISSDCTTLTHGSSPREEKAPASLPWKPPGDMPEKSPAAAPVVSRSVHQEPMSLVKMDEIGGVGGYAKPEEGGGGSCGGGSNGGIGGSGRRTRRSLSILKSAKREKMVKRAALGFRVFGALLCLVSFSVMAANRNMGWALDSFYRYKEFWYFMCVNVMGFVYSAAQAIDLAYHSATGNYGVRHSHRRVFDFAMDQMITYLLISASSSATTRIDDWQSNWGKDKFPDLASASVSMSYLAFLALAFSSLVSGYALSTSKSMHL